MAEAQGEVGDDAGDGRDREGALEEVLGAAELGLADGDAALAGGEAGQGLGALGAKLGNPERGLVEGGFHGRCRQRAGIDRFPDIVAFQETH